MNISAKILENRKCIGGKGRTTRIHFLFYEPRRVLSKTHINVCYIGLEKTFVRIRKRNIWKYLTRKRIDKGIIDTLMIQ